MHRMVKFGSRTRTMAVVVIATLIQGCTMATNMESRVFDRQQTAAEAQQQLNAKLSSVPLARGQLWLAEQGFSCQPLAPVADQIGLAVLCRSEPVTRTEDVPTVDPLVPVSWIVRIVAADGVHISSVQVLRTPSDLGG